jgi:hypothetical protein
VTSRTPGLAVGHGVLTARGRTAPVELTVPANPWAIFRGYLDGVAAQAASAVVPRWIDRLGGADVYTLSNAYQLVKSLRIDYGHLGPFGIHP